MIHRVRLRNWRSYEDLDLSLDPGTTFVVAPNGVGKTSLVCGLAWAVFGPHSGVDPKACIRAGANHAEVQVQLDIPDGRQLTIGRTVKRSGTPTATFTIDGAALPEKSALAQMEQALGVELSVAGRLSMMLGGGHLAAQEALDLESHLYHAFGVSDLLGAAEIAESVAKEAERARVALRSSTRQQMDNRTALESEIVELETEVARLEMRGAELEQMRQATATQRSLVERELALASEWERYERRRSQLIAEATHLLGQPAATDNIEWLDSTLRTDLSRVELAVSAAVEGTVVARSVITSADEAIELLGRGGAVCPTCMRPLPPDQRHSAISAHETQRGDAQVELRRLDGERAGEHAHAQAVAALLAQVDALERPPVVARSPSVPSRAEAEARYQQASTALDEHNRQLGAARSHLQSLQARIASDDQIRKEETEIRLAYRREAVALAGALALRDAADRVIESHIKPIAREVQGRWKHLFTNNGLTFRADGSITRVRDGEELAWDTLSGGERTWARIVTHLLVMATTTSLPFAWFDEPLEHLDPQLRHAVAATLATATRGGSPRQLLVTTYEHGIAQQLVNDTEGARIIAIRESGAH